MLDLLPKLKEVFDQRVETYSIRYAIEERPVIRD